MQGGQCGNAALHFHYLTGMVPCPEMVFREHLGVAAKFCRIRSVPLSEYMALAEMCHGHCKFLSRNLFARRGAVFWNLFCCIRFLILAFLAALLSVTDAAILAVFGSVHSARFCWALSGQDALATQGSHSRERAFVA